MGERGAALAVTCTVLVCVTVLLALRVAQGEQVGILVGIYPAALLYWARSPNEVMNPRLKPGACV